MRRWLAIALIVLPLAELGSFFYVAERIGYGVALAALVIAGITGIALIRVQGFRALFELPQALLAGGGPFGFKRWLRRQLGYIAAGVLLVVPGFLTDGLALLIIMVQLFVPAPPTPPAAPPPAAPPSPGPSGRILEGEYRTEKPPRA